MKYNFKNWISLVFFFTFVGWLLMSPFIYANDNYKQSRSIPVWVLYSDRNTDAELRIEPGFSKEERFTKSFDEACVINFGCNQMSYTDKRYSTCYDECTTYTEWKRIKLLRYDKKPFDQDLVIWNVKNR